MVLKARTFLVFLIGLWVAGCGEKPVTKVYEAAYEQPITCLRYSVFPPEKRLEAAIKPLYPFRNRCPVTVEVRHKENICCNSTQNVQQKTLSRFPHHFLRLEVRRGMTPLYSYYIDLDHPADEEDIKQAFERMRDDLKMGR